MENLRKGTTVHMIFDTIVGIVGTFVTLISILVTGISIWQNHKISETQNSNRTRLSCCLNRN